MGLLAQSVHEIQEGGEHTQVVRRFHQLADHVDGLSARVEVDVWFFFGCSEDALLDKRVSRS